MGEKKDVNIDSTNIFDEFSGDEKIKQEIEYSEQEKKKNVSFYIGVLSNFFTTINLILLLGFIIFGGYFYLQNDNTLTEASYLSPICSFFIDNPVDDSTCSSVTALIKKYESDNIQLKKDYFNTNITLIDNIYKNLNFIDSKEVSFLINKTKNRVKVLEMLTEFDKLKYEFSPLNKTLLKCENININSDYIMEIQCSAYSGYWDDEILGYTGENKGKDRVSGTSISVATSFINFIEKSKKDGSKSNFFIIEKPKKFNYIEIVDNNGYTKKTDFKLKLKYKDNILLPKI